MTKIKIEEVMQNATAVVSAGFAPYLLYSEVLEGARRPLAFLQVVKEDFSLIGKDGYTINFMTASQLGASEDTEANITGSGMTGAAKTIAKVPLTVPNAVYCAIELTDMLLEDFPSIDWVRLSFRNMGSAVMEYVDADIYTIMAAVSTVTASCTTLDYATVVDALATMENNKWFADENSPPFLLVAPSAAAGMLKDTQFVETRRYTTHELSKIVEGEMGLYGGCRVLKTSHLDNKAYAFIVFPPDGPNGPVVVLAWKRRLTVKNEYQAKYAYTYYVTSLRAKSAVVQAYGMCRITQTTTP